MVNLEKKYFLRCGNNLELIKKLEDNSIDSIVTDPPYELGFMGKKWDSTGIAFNVELWKEALRVLKPGGHLIAFSGSRTYHRIASAIEDAGFEIRDQIMWIYCSGFPKSLDVSKAIDGKLLNNSSNTKDFKKLDGDKTISNLGYSKNCEEQGARPENYNGRECITNFKPSTEQAKQWKGWGTALKPAHEPMVLARKPLGEKTVAENVLKHGVGAINIDECRVGDEVMKVQASGKTSRAYQSEKTTTAGGLCNESIGRWPANFIHDGNLFSEEVWSRYFYCPKASKKDRNDGLNDFEDKVTNDGRLTEIDNAYQRGITERKNHHPTVKPTDLMAYLVKLITPKNGTILDLFNGSGSTGKAVMRLNGKLGEDSYNYTYIGFDLDKEYINISKARIYNEYKKFN